VHVVLLRGDREVVDPLDHRVQVGADVDRVFVNAARVAAEVFEERGLPTSPPGASSRQPPVDPELEFPGAFPQTPYLRDLLNQVVYAETWKRAEMQSEVN